MEIIMHRDPLTRHVRVERAMPKVTQEKVMIVEAKHMRPTRKFTLQPIHWSSKSRMINSTTLSAGAALPSVKRFTVMVDHTTVVSKQPTAKAESRWCKCFTNFVVALSFFSSRGLAKKPRGMMQPIRSADGTRMLSKSLSACAVKSAMTWQLTGFLRKKGSRLEPPSKQSPGVPASIFDEESGVSQGCRGTPTVQAGFAEVVAHSAAATAAVAR
mmetsp:Transcript_21553/g.50258  ORF Transcript_21553/g.50258 Transcript_21553/m.50258 type:complete len:214 (-) Transcript_21553:33-674(-)